LGDLLISAFHHRHKGEVFKHFFFGATIGLFGEVEHTLYVALSYRDHHFAAHLHLLDQFGGNIGRGSRDDHFVERTIGRQSFKAIAIKIFDIGILIPQDELPVLIKQLLLPLDGSSVMPFLLSP
jgi:hypothetical protein